MALEPGIIRRLEEDVVNRIAAGEVIQRPANALKELLENALDAKSTSITVVVDSGGMKLLQITDNGTGIRQDDLPIVCERFTTSKLKTFSDLTSISTYGFRGEALASISHVARLTILTRTRDSQFGLKAEYRDGKLVNKPKPSAANPGTQITVEDLFFNVPTRRKALKSASEEFFRINEVMCRYAVHNSGIAFTLKKIGESGVELRTQTGTDTKGNIASIFGPSIAKELIPFEISDQTLGFTCKGLTSNVNLGNQTKLTFLLFINNRLVDSSALRKSIELVYSAYLPKGSHPFVYMSLEINPQNVDVNVHPTKHEVHFLYQDEIVEKIQQGIDAKLLGSNVSRTFYTQTLMPGATVPLPELTPEPSKVGKKSANSEREDPKNMVRTDSKEQKLEKFLKRKSPTKRPHTEEGSNGDSHAARVIKEPAVTRKIDLESVFKLRKAVKDNGHPALRNLIKNHSFVGCINRRFALLQHETQLFVANTITISEHLFHQLFFARFGNFGVIKFDKPASIYDLAMLALDQPEAGWRESDGEKSELATYTVKLLQMHSEMLWDYFSIEVTKEGNICSIPVILDGYIPCLDGLPMYILRLATEVNWDKEEPCFKTFAIETARFYRISPDENSRYDSRQLSGEESQSEDSGSEVVEHAIYSAAKQFLIPPKSCLKDMTFTTVANLPDLYKVFERC